MVVLVVVLWCVGVGGVLVVVDVVDVADVAGVAGGSWCRRWRWFVGFLVG